MIDFFGAGLVLSAWVGTLPIHFLAGYVAGAVIALVARAPLLKTWEPLRTRYFSAVLMFALAAMCPSGIVLYFSYPDWSMMYLVNPDQVPTLIGLLLVLGFSFSTPVVGFFVTHRLMRRRPHLLHWTLGGALALFLITLILGWSRLVTVAYYDAFHYGGQQLSLSGSPLLIMLLFSVPATVGLFAFTTMFIRRHLEQTHDLSA